MAECLARSKIPAGCSNISVSSAGISGRDSDERANPRAIEEMRQRGLDLSGHQVRGLSEELVRGATRIYVMSQHHLEDIIGTYPLTSEKTALLKLDGTSVSDPYMCAQEVYKKCADEIEAAVSKRIQALI